MTYTADPVQGFIQALIDLASDPGTPAQLPERPTTEQAIASLLTQNTGAHMLDSGMYGRHHERNRAKAEAAGDPVAAFEAEPEVNVQVSVWGEDDDKVEVLLTQSVYHFLKPRLTFEPELTAQWQSFLARPEVSEWGMLECVEAFPLYRAGKLRDEAGNQIAPLNRDTEDDDLPDGIGGIYGEGRQGFTVNTYNGEDSLSQTLQYHYWEEDGGARDEEAFVLLSVHGGADVRGGYSDYLVFSVYETDILDNARLHAWCNNDEHDADQLTLEGTPAPRCEARWSSDNAGYSWDDDEGNGAGDLFDADLYPPKVGTEGEIGRLVVDPETNRVWCPVCGKSTLSFFGAFANG